MNIGKEDFYFSILEKNIENNLLFPIKININGLSFGTFDSPTYMPSFIYSLQRLIQSKEDSNQFFDRINFLEKFFINNELVDNYHFTLEETFDDFAIRCAKNNKFIFFLFQLDENPFFTYPHLEVGKIYAESIPIESVEFALKKLIKYQTSLTYF